MIRLATTKNPTIDATGMELKLVSRRDSGGTTNQYFAAAMVSTTVTTEGLKPQNHAENAIAGARVTKGAEAPRKGPKARQPNNPTATASIGSRYLSTPL